MAEQGKLSLHKVMAPQGEWGGLGQGQSFYNGADPRRGAALIVGENGWPEGMIQPPQFRPHTDYPVDTKSVLRNGFGPEDIARHEPITRVGSMTTGSEVEVSIHGARVSQDVLERVKAVGQERGTGGYATFEVRDDMIEGNRPVVNATFQEVVTAARAQNEVLVSVAEELGARLSFESAASLPNEQAGPPNDAYVQAMADVLADGFLTDSPKQLSWAGLVSTHILEPGRRGQPMRHQEIAEQLSDLPFARRMISEFCCKAHHIHLRPEQQNPNFYAFALNHIMGGVGLNRAVASFSGPFKNGMFAKVHEVKQLQRLLFRTAGFQPGYLEMGTDEANAEMDRNMRDGSAASLTRSYITDNKAHGNSRIRTEGTLRTAELLFPSTHPLAEVEATQVMAYAYDLAILSHYYDGQGTQGNIPFEAQRFYAEPNEDTYDKNRIAIAINGPYAQIIDGHGNKVSYADYMHDYAQFLGSEIQRLGIETPRGEVAIVTDWLTRTTRQPREWNIANYLNPSHPDYGVGCLSTHMIGELAARVYGEEWRHASWPNLRKRLSTGHYDAEIAGIIADFTTAIHTLYQS